MPGNILILSAGRRVTLTEAFMIEAAVIDPGIKVFTADAEPDLSSACQISHGYFKVPKATTGDYISFLEKLVKDNDIKIVIPTIDTELLVLSKYRDKFEKDGIYIMTPHHDFISVCRNKRMTNEYFLNKGIATAKEMDASSVTYPLFAKPIDGSSSNHIYYAPDSSYLPPFVLHNERFMLMEYLDRNVYDEYTLDVYLNREGRLCCIVPRFRIETRGGEVSKGVTRKNFLINFMREKFSSIPGARGCITFQLFVHRNNNDIRGIEINPRFGGGYPLSYHAGANYPSWIIKEYLMNETVSWFDEWEEDLLMLRYDSEILVHDFKAR